MIDPNSNIRLKAILERHDRVLGLIEGDEAFGFWSVAGCVVQSGFLGDVGAWVVHRPGGRCGHVLDAQILEHDQAVVLRKIERSGLRLKLLKTEPNPIGMTFGLACSINGHPRQ